jgi:radical SAM superfamily enzyme YgiQ (UPF0313 family)
MPASADILLVAVNARYGHCSFAARTLLANAGVPAGRIAILEADLDIQPFQLAADIVARHPRLAGFSVYLWNRAIVREALSILCRIAPDLHVVLGGPEIVADDTSAWNALADYLVIGEGEGAFREICTDFVVSHLGRAGPPDPPEKDGACSARALPILISTPPEDLSALALPYELYSDDDIAHRTLFVESSRGCPFRCVYCTSCGTPVRLVPLEKLLSEFDRLLARGVRAFRFLDRSFNAVEEHACAVLDFFLARYPERLALHFEIMPRKLGVALRQRLAAFPPGVLHLEVGVQTLDAEVARRIGRPADISVALETLQFLMREARATVHADLIFGLPGETLASFAAGFDKLVREYNPPELQVNLLKRLPGTPLAHDPRFNLLVFNPHPPYELLASDVLDFDAIVRLQRFARCWDLVHNRGRFPRTSARLCLAEDTSPFARFLALAERIQNAEGRLHALGMTRLSAHLAAFLESDCGISTDEALALVAADRE